MYKHGGAEGRRPDSVRRVVVGGGNRAPEVVRMKRVAKHWQKEPRYTPSLMLGQSGANIGERRRKFADLGPSVHTNRQELGSISLLVRPRRPEITRGNGSQTFVHSCRPAACPAGGNLSSMFRAFCRATRCALGGFVFRYFVQVSETRGRDKLLGRLVHAQCG